MTHETQETLAMALGIPVLFAVLFYLNSKIKTSYTRASLVTGLAMPPLVSVIFDLSRLIDYPYIRGETSWIYPFIISRGPALLFSLLAGWWFMSGRKLPATLKDRYIPLLLLPALPYLLVMSFFPAEFNPNLHFWLSEAMRYGMPWLMFVLGVCLGARKNAPAREWRQGVVRMLGYIGLACIFIGTNLYDIVSNTLYGPRDNVGRSVITWHYGPFSDLVARPAKQPSLQITDNYPAVYGQSALLPLYGAIIRAVYAPGENRETQSFQDTLRELVQDSWLTDREIPNLMRGRYDVLFDDLPTIQRDLTQSQEREKPEITPVAHEALVFFVHKDNPVTDVSLDQLKDIYAGKIRSWKDVGGRAAKILAFQHELSRTQKALQTMIMHGQATISPLMEEYSDHFDSVQRQVAVYRNRPNALGYAFLWEANKLFPAGEIRFLKINGIAPTPENIRNGTYPLAFPIVMATRPSPDKEVGKLRDWICGPEGQELIERSGFLPLEKKAAAPEEGPLDLRTLPDIAATPRPSLQKTLTAGI